MISVRVSKYLVSQRTEAYAAMPAASAPTTTPFAVYCLAAGTFCIFRFA